MKYFFATVLLLCFFNSAKSQTTPSPLVKTSGCVEGSCDNGTGKYLFLNGDKFNGEWHGGLRNGYGRYDYKNGDWYIGDFRNDKIEGKGALHLHDGKVIDGEWLDYELVKISKPENQSSLHLRLPVMQNKQ